jgi:hypothetical protein
VGSELQTVDVRELQRDLLAHGAYLREHSVEALAADGEVGYAVVERG